MNAAKISLRSSQSYIHTARSSPPQAKHPHVPPLIHQDYRPSQRWPRWPPSPVAEDEAISLSKEYMPSLPDISKEEARYRGEIDQQPSIIAVHLPPSTIVTPSRADRSTIDSTSLKSNSSSEVSSPRTPLDNDCINIDRRYVYIPETGIEIPLTYDEPRSPKYEKKSRIPRDMDDSRSRKELPRLETDLSLIEPLQDRPSRHERAPSPYAYTLKPSKTIKDPIPGESLAAADVVSPKVGFNVSGTKAGAKGARHDPSLSGEGAATQAIPRSMNRHVVDIGYPSESPSVGECGVTVQSTPYPLSSDESDLSADELSPSRMRNSVGLCSPQSPPKYSMPRFEDFSRRRADRGLPYDATFSPAPVVSVDEKGAPLTYMRMPSSTGLQHGHALPSSPGSKSGNMPPLSPGLEHGNKPLQSPGLRYDNMSPSSPQAGRRALPQGSVTTSPASSPQATPERTNAREVGHATNARKTPPGVRHSSRPTSRPASPVQLFGSPETRNLGSSPRNPPGPVSNTKKLQSQTRSRSPSPGIRGASYIQALPSIGVREPSPARPGKMTHAVSEDVITKSSRHATLTPFLTPQPPGLERPAPGGRRRALSNVETRPKISFSEPRSETLVLALPSPRAKLRSPSHHRTVSFGSQPLALLPCPRPSPVAGFTDWYTLVGNSSFSICPSCRRTVFSAGYAKHFKPSRPESAGSKRRCDMSTPWMRMALLLTISTKRPDPKLICAMADIIVDELPCPGKARTAGSWYRVVSPEDGKQVSGFNVCPCCVRNVETIFPALRGVYQKSRSRHPDQERTCDLRADSKRFTAYIDLLESTANQAQEFKRRPNMLRFTDLAEKMAAIPECSRDDMLLDQPWHTIVHIPELTVCEDCYREVVRPAARQGYSVAAQFSRKPHRIGPRDVGISCQLYSTRMKSTFMEACRRDDLAGLKSVAMQRHQIETGLQRRIREVQADVEDDKTFERVTGLVEEWKRWE